MLRKGETGHFHVRGIEEARTKRKSGATRRGWNAGDYRIDYALHSEASFGGNTDDIVWRDAEYRNKLGSNSPRVGGGQVNL